MSVRLAAAAARAAKLSDALNAGAVKWQAQNFKSMCVTVHASATDKPCADKCSLPDLGIYAQAAVHQRSVDTIEDVSDGS